MPELPREPPASAWELPNPHEAPADVELLALGADLNPGTMLAGYRRGIFPMKVDISDGSSALGWWCPNPRGVLAPSAVHVSRSLRRSMSRFVTTTDRAFEAVVAGCADPSRPHGWIDSDFTTAYLQLHELGWAHSVEVWRPGEDGMRLVGGLFGVQFCGVFAAESMYHQERDASKVAVVALCHRIAQLPDGLRRLIDVQWPTDHLETLGVVAVPRLNYLRRLADLANVPPAW